ncbi:chorismate mutase / prephenate dehydratase [[Clostridium] aminophilum]|uniref:Bifunctional chorismate mutase/prephenate dehydratase n=2 Tax=[Clostridium] aminophilum TaxID=1526 RepID=A0A1I0DGQ0_9FIRM|nr:bifunctional chorismate mutase/prephenate dehydratase [[Clostridium] aminophilum]SET31262.1 chorismate mutase / prephenate dehydratase [[Clostridium] aminophilum]
MANSNHPEEDSAKHGADAEMAAGETVADVRRELDELDPQLKELFLRRMELNRRLGEAKLRNGREVYDPARENRKLQAVSGDLEDEFNRNAVRELFMHVMTLGRRYQYQTIKQLSGDVDENDGTFGFERISELDYENSRIAYQGLPGAYGQIAAERFFGEDADIHHVKKFEDLMRELQFGDADFAVMPIENSTAGVVSGNYELLQAYDNYIVAEIFVPVNHCLLTVPGAKLSDIRKVYSHPQSLMQCTGFLEHAGWEQQPMENNAVAAKKVVEDGDPSCAAIASETAGRIYGLNVLKRSINDRRDNTTRFLIIANRPVYLLGAEKISLCFEVPHRSGSLYSILGNFIYNNVNMTMIQSRPIPDMSWEYRFFVDIEGNLSSSAVRSALAAIFREAQNVRILGNY